jgi:hypothetical protein
MSHSSFVYDEALFDDFLKDDSYSEVSSSPSILSITEDVGVEKKGKRKDIEKREAFSEAFGRNPRPGYYLQYRDGILIEHIRKDSTEPIKPLTPLKSFLGNGVEVEIKTSTIVDAGQGLFLKKAGENISYVDTGTLICLYDGVLVTSKNRIAKYLLKQKKNDYLWEGLHRKSSYFLIDACDPDSCYARYANDALSHLNNSEIQFKEPYGASAKVFLIATRRIYVGEEIFAPYGKEYWVKDKRQTPPSLLRKAIQYYSPEELVVPKEILILEEPVPVTMTKRTREELLEDYYKKKKLLEKLQVELADLEKILG